MISETRYGDNDKELKTFKTLQDYLDNTNANLVLVDNDSRAFVLDANEEKVILFSEYGDGPEVVDISTDAKKAFFDSDHAPYTAQDPKDIFVFANSEFEAFAD